MVISPLSPTDYALEYLIRKLVQKGIITAEESRLIHLMSMSSAYQDLKNEMEKEKEEKK